ncbi:MAG: hypothetical protein SXA11_22310 [Cyanobacteriota bacterium]|nr:hypothetical protein [Cyanobacteriota bacterium]
MEPNQVNESLSKEQLKNETKISPDNTKNLVEYYRTLTEQIKQSENITYQDVEKVLDVQRQIYKDKISRDSSTSTIVENYLVAAAGIGGGAALLSSILGPTAATIAALVVAVTYIFLNIKKTLPKPEQESDSTGDTNA